MTYIKPDIEFFFRDLSTILDRYSYKIDGTIELTAKDNKTDNYKISKDDSLELKYKKYSTVDGIWFKVDKKVS